MASRLVTLLIAGSFLVSTAGCGGGSSPIPGPNSSRAAESQSSAGLPASTLPAARAGTTAYAYSCDGVQTCYVYDGHGHPIGSVTGLSHPSGTATDPQGNWYIANPGAQTVLEYSAGGETLENTLNDAGETPLGVAISTTTSTIAVMNASNSVSVYVSGATTPTRMLQPSGAFPLAIAVDTKGNCYLADDVSFSGFLEKFDACAGSPSRVGPKVGIHYNGMAFDGHDNLYFSEMSPSSAAVEQCHGLKNCRPIWVPQYQQPGPIGFNAKFGRLIVGDYLGPIYTLVAKRGHRVKRFAAPNPSSQINGVTFAVGPTY